MYILNFNQLDVYIYIYTYDICIFYMRQNVLNVNQSRPEQPCACTRVYECACTRVYLCGCMRV